AYGHVGPEACARAGLRADVRQFRHLRRDVPRSHALRATELDVRGGGLGRPLSCPERDLERRARTRCGPERERSSDRAQACANIEEPLAALRAVPVEALAVVGDRDVPAPIALLDPHLGPARAGVAPECSEDLLEVSDEGDLIFS